MRLTSCLVLYYLQVRFSNYSNPTDLLIIISLPLLAQRLAILRYFTVFPNPYGQIKILEKYSLTTSTFCGY
jgi:hypothetical protein